MRKGDSPSAKNGFITKVYYGPDQEVLCIENCMFGAKQRDQGCPYTALRPKQWVPTFWRSAAPLPVNIQNTTINHKEENKLTKYKSLRC